MRDLTNEERVQFEQRQAGLDAFVQEGMEVLGEFMNRLELPEPYMVLRNAERYLSPVDSWMRDQVVSSQDRGWIITRIGYFIGELFNQRLGGYWFVEIHPDSPFFLQYVVGRFTGVPSLNARISPFAIAANYVDQPVGRSLSAMTTRVEDQLRQCTSEGV